jgi:hypothetical protein
MEIEGIDQLETIVKKVVMELLSEIRPLPMPAESNYGPDNGDNGGDNGGGNSANHNNPTQNGAVETGHYWIPAHCAQVTEIIIRVGPPAAVQTLERGGGPPCVPCLPCCPPTFVPSTYLDADIPLSKEDRALLQKIMDVTRDTSGELLHKLGREIGTRRLSRDIKNFAASLGIKP